MRDAEIFMRDTAGKFYKIYLVEVDDIHNERVLCATVGSFQLKEEVIDFGVEDKQDDKPLMNVTAKLRFVANPDGTYFKIVNSAWEEE